MKKSEGDKRRKSPSREKYERENPTVSARVPKKTRDGLYANLAKQGLSLADALKVLAGELELKVRPIDEARQAGYEEGWGKGIKQGKALYAVSYRCSVCGKEIVVTTDYEKKAIKTYMREHGWGHGDCIDRRYS